MSVFKAWKDAVEDDSIEVYFHSEEFSSGGKTEKIVVPPKPGYDLLGIMINVGGVVLTAAAAEAVVSGAESLMDLLKNIKGRINNKSTLSINNADLLERICAYFGNEDVVVSSGRKASLLAAFGGAGSATHYLGIIIPFVVLDGEGQATLEWEMNAITDLYAADVTIAAFNFELVGIYGHWNNAYAPFGINCVKPSIPASGDKDLAVEFRGEARRSEIFTGVGSDAYVDNIDIEDSKGGPILRAEGDQMIAATENKFLVTRDTGEFIVTHVPAQITTYMVENAHTSAITPFIVSIYDRTVRPRSSPEKVTPDQLTESSPVLQPEASRPGNARTQVQGSGRSSGFLGKLLNKK